MGFSVRGLCVAVAILLPNLLFLLFPPVNTPDGLRDSHLFITIAENAGRIAVPGLLVLSKDSFQDARVDVWFVLMAACALVYYALWARYVVLGRDFALLFDPLWFIPVPMAVFPALAFGFAAMWGRSVPLGVAAAVFAAAHIAGSWHTYMQTRP